MALTENERKPNPLETGEIPQAEQGGPNPEAGETRESVGNEQTARKEALDTISALDALKVDHAGKTPETRGGDAVPPLNPVEAKNFMNKLLAGNEGIDASNATEASRITKLLEQIERNDEITLD